MHQICKCTKRGNNNLYKCHSPYFVPSKVFYKNDDVCINKSIKICTKFIRDQRQEKGRKIVF